MDGGIQMNDIDKKYYIQEVEELTNLLRSDDDWKDLHSVLTNKKFNVDTLMLVTFFESDDDMEYGAFITEDKSAFEYSRSTSANCTDIEINKLEDMEKAIKKYPQFAVVLEMIKKI